MTGLTHSPDSFVFKTDRPWPNARLRVGAIVGHATSSSVRLWLRTGQPGSFTLFVYARDRVVEAHRGEAALRLALSAVPMEPADVATTLSPVLQRDFEITDYASDTTIVIDTDGLEPDTAYGYALLDRRRACMILGHNRLRRFRTPPEESERRPFQFALLSCHMPFAVNGLFRKRTEASGVDMWDFLDAALRRHGHEVDLVIAGGDQAYSDGVDTLNIWQYLNARMARDGDRLLPDREAMLSWYRDIHRGYWGFESLQRVFDSFPTYMIWDDHEIVDGWGSHYFDADSGQDGLAQLLPDYRERGLSYDDGMTLVRRMVGAAQQTYLEYQHSHNPATLPGVFDYSFERGGGAFYVLDGRGHRDISRSSHRILGREQFDRFAGWAAAVDPAETPFMFVVSAVPVLHTRSAVVNADEYLGGLGDDLRDSWEHELHDAERAALMEVLFDAAARGIKVGVLSGDVHASAAFSIEDDDGNRVYQLTSSAITQNVSRIASWALRLGAADDGETAEGYRFRRLALYTEPSFALISVDPLNGEAWFKLYGGQKLDVPPAAGGQTEPLTHSLAKIQISQRAAEEVGGPRG
ncbi:MAG: alkaline phosphatase D family protein [Chloroflexi bacterium]|nr:alkaline phosphatase D family protein [Chloroflexota bacterium]